MTDTAKAADCILGVLRDATTPLLGREVAAQVTRRSGSRFSQRDANRILYGELSGDVQRDDAGRWRLAVNSTRTAPTSLRVQVQEGTPGAGALSNTRRLWTEEDVALVYWALPVMRLLTEATSRPFSAIAMKMANLLAVETGGAEGLQNASRLDQAVVERYSIRRDELEQRAVKMLLRPGGQTTRAAEVQVAAERVLQNYRVPLHVELVAMIMTARDPLSAAPSSAIREALRDSPHVSELSADVFEYVSPPSGAASGVPT